jgi:hypothetical protein
VNIVLCIPSTKPFPIPTLWRNSSIFSLRRLRFSVLFYTDLKLIFVYDVSKSFFFYGIGFVCLLGFSLTRGLAIFSLPWISSHCGNLSKEV